MKVSAPFEPAICVADFEKCLAFYRDVLGMRVFAIDDIPASPSAAARLTPDGYRIARVETSGGDRLKIVCPKVPPQARPASEYAMQRSGFSYLTFIVPDLRDVMRRVRDAGAEVVTGPEPVAFRPGIVELFFVLDPEGNRLEFVERNDMSTYRPESRPESRPASSAQAKG